MYGDLAERLQRCVREINEITAILASKGIKTSIESEDCDGAVGRVGSQLLKIKFEV